MSTAGAVMLVALLALSAAAAVNGQQHPKISAVSSSRRFSSEVGQQSGTTAQSMAKAVSRQIAELKAREHSRREAALAASAKKAISKSGLSPRGRKGLVDQVFRPSATSPRAEEQEQQAAPFEDPFANLHVDFAAEQQTELKKATNLLGAKKRLRRGVVAQDATEAVDQDLRAREQQVVAEAGRDTGPATEDFVYDVGKDLNGGVEKMEKDAEQMATQESTKAERDAEAKVAEGKKANAAKKGITAIAASHGQAAKQQPPPPAKAPQESLGQAEEEVHEAEERQSEDKQFQALGKLWAKKDNDAKLNSELATEVRVNQGVVQAKMAKAMEIENDQEASQLEDINSEWEHLFPGTATEPKVQSAGNSAWGAFSNELAEKGIPKF